METRYKEVKLLQILECILLSKMTPWQEDNKQIGQHFVNHIRIHFPLRSLLKCDYDIKSRLSNFSSAEKIISISFFAHPGEKFKFEFEIL